MNAPRRPDAPQRMSATGTPAAPAGRPLTLDLALTARCPLRCRYCTVEKVPVPELTALQWRKVMAAIARLRPIALISLEGGEPFARSDLAMILAAGLEHAAEVKIVTSGTLPIDALPAHLFGHPRLRVEVSVDGPKPVHDYLRDGSHDAAWRFIDAALERGSRLRLRSVVSVFNVQLLEPWLEAVDLRLAGVSASAGYRFDTLIAPEALEPAGGPVTRLALRRYDSAGLLPAPAQVWDLYHRLQRKPFQALRFEQTEAFRGCGIGRQPLVSFDPSGRFSFCCEVPRGFGKISETTAQRCLALLDAQTACLPCHGCAHLADRLCDGCWTGQKCGMVSYWKTGDCRTLLSSVAAPPRCRQSARG